MSKLKSNPYVTAPLKSSDMFFGREDELNEIINRRIKLSPPASTILLGGRKIGKTSFLYQLYNRLKKRSECNQTANSYNMIPIYINLHSMTNLTISTFFQEIITEILKQKDFLKKQDIPHKNISNDPYKLFLNNMWYIFEKSSEHIENVRYAILIDESESLLNRSWTNDILSNIRELINTSDFRDFISLVITGFRELHDSTMIEDRDGSILGNAAYWLNLGVLSYNDWFNLMTDPINGELNHELIKTVEELSGCHPFITQYLMQRIWKSKPKHITEEDVFKAKTDFNMYIKVFSSWYQKFKIIDKDVYLSIAQNEKPKYSHGEIEDSLEFLSYTGVIKKQSDTFIIGSTLFHDWFNKRTTHQYKQKIDKQKKNMNTITWLHLSDLHYCDPDTGWDGEKVFRKLKNDLRYMEREYQLVPDFLFFTGDLAKGNLEKKKGWNLKDQYEGVNSCLEKISACFDKKIAKKNMFLVPGNHDVDIKIVLNSTTEWIDKQDEDTITEMIKNADKNWKNCMKRLTAYRAFLKKFHFNHLLLDPNRLFYGIKRNVNNIKVGIGGFNSAWSSCRESKVENGKLKLGAKFQLNNIYEQLNDADISVVLIHHPPNWFAEEEDKKFEIKLQESFTFCLHGHEHLGWVDEKSNGHTTISANACYRGSDKTNGYNFVRLDLDNKVAEVWLRKYEDAGSGGWIPNIFPSKTDNNGKWELSNTEWMNKLKLKGTK